MYDRLALSHGGIVSPSPAGALEASSQLRRRDMQPTLTRNTAALKASFAFLLLLLGVVGHGAIALAQSPGTFSATGHMITPRFLHTATLLLDGRVLIAGGDSSYATRQRRVQRRTLRSGYRDICGDRQYDHPSRRPHGHVASKRQSAHRRRRASYQRRRLLACLRRAL